MISISVDVPTRLNLISLKTKNDMSSAFMKKIFFDGNTISLHKATIEEIKDLSKIFNELIINYNDKCIAEY